jgi:hypothetical protein
VASEGASLPAVTPGKVWEGVWSVLIFLSTCLYVGHVSPLKRFLKSWSWSSVHSTVPLGPVILNSSSGLPRGRPPASPHHL